MLGAPVVVYYDARPLVPQVAEHRARIAKVLRTGYRFRFEDPEVQARYGEALYRENGMVAGWRTLHWTPAM